LVLGEPIVRFLLQRGVMTAASVDLVAGVLRFFVLGLLPFSLFQLFLRAFYALQDTKTPFLINCGAVIVNIAINIPMFRLLQVEGLAAGHAIAYVFGVTMQCIVLSRRIGGLDARHIVASIARMVAAAGAMGVLVWGLYAAIEGTIDPTGIIGQLVAIGVSVAAGVAAYLGFANLLGVEEIGYARALVTRRLAPK
jgi:putative peptidoglycan lipid II flippase